MKCLVIIEPTETGFSAYSPDLPGCVSTRTTHAEVEDNMREAIELHLEGLREEGYPVPNRALRPPMSRSRLESPNRGSGVRRSGLPLPASP